MQHPSYSVGMPEFWKSEVPPGPMGRITHIYESSQAACADIAAALREFEHGTDAGLVIDAVPEYCLDFTPPFTSARTVAPRYITPDQDLTYSTPGLQQPSHANLRKRTREGVPKCLALPIRPPQTKRKGIATLRKFRRASSKQPGNGSLIQNGITEMDTPSASIRATLRRVLKHVRTILVSSMGRSLISNPNTLVKCILLTKLKHILCILKCCRIDRSRMS